MKNSSISPPLQSNCSRVGESRPTCDACSREPPAHWRSFRSDFEDSTGRGGRQDGPDQHDHRQDSNDDFKLGNPPIFLAGERALTLEPVGTNRVYGLTNAFVTTDDLAEPGYRIRARSITIREDRRITARDATLYVGDTPVFWYPYYTRRFGEHPLRWVLTPGYRSLYGAYLRASYQVDLGTNSQASLNIDPYTRRGLGLGPELKYDLEPLGKGLLTGYWIADQNPGEDPVTCLLYTSPSPRD